MGRKVFTLVSSFRPRIAKVHRSQSLDLKFLVKPKKALPITSTGDHPRQILAASEILDLSLGSKERDAMSFVRTAILPFIVRQLLVVSILAALLLPPAPISPRAESVPYGYGLLWQIEAEGAEPSYLLGTMHSNDPQVVALPAPVDDAFAAARSVTLEVIVNEDVREELATSMIMMDGRRLDKILDSERFERVTEIAAIYGLPALAVTFMKPWALAVLFSFPPDEVDRQAAGERPLDEMLQAEAEARSLPLYGLEQAGEQLKWFETMSEPDQLAFLDWVVSQHGQGDRWFGELRRLYLDRDTGGMMNLMAGLDEKAAKTAVFFKDRVIDQRNRLMAERMLPRLNEGGAFVAVGALHLPGQEGILSLLAARGYEVTRIY